MIPGRENQLNTTTKQPGQIITTFEVTVRVTLRHGRPEGTLLGLPYHPDIGALGIYQDGASIQFTLPRCDRRLAAAGIDSAYLEISGADNALDLGEEFFAEVLPRLIEAEGGNPEAAKWRDAPCPGGCYNGWLFDGDPADPKTDTMECDRCDGGRFAWITDGQERMKEPRAR